MTQKQKDYLVKRIDAICEKKLAELDTDCSLVSSTAFYQMNNLIKQLIEKGILPEPKLLLDAFYEAVEKGNYSVYILNAFNQKKVNSFIEKNKLAKEKIIANNSLLTSKIKNRASKIKDEILFGNSEEALRLIRDFENF